MAQSRGLANGESNERKSTDYEDPDFDEVEFDELEVNEAAERESEGSGSEDQIDDPVRMYLMQMGEIPLLSRDQEIESAKRIEYTRRRFRHSMLASDYLLQGAVTLLEKVRDGQVAARSNDRSFGDEYGGQKADYRQAGTESENADAFASLESRRFCRRH